MTCVDRMAEAEWRWWREVADSVRGCDAFRIKVLQVRALEFLGLQLYSVLITWHVLTEWSRQCGERRWWREMADSVRGCDAARTQVLRVRALEFGGLEFPHRDLSPPLYQVCDVMLSYFQILICFISQFNVPIQVEEMLCVVSLFWMSYYYQMFILVQCLKK